MQTNQQHAFAKVLFCRSVLQLCGTPDERRVKRVSGLSREEPSGITHCECHSGELNVAPSVTAVLVYLRGSCSLQR